MVQQQWSGNNGVNITAERNQSTMPTTTSPHRQQQAQQPFVTTTMTTTATASSSASDSEATKKKKGGLSLGNLKSPFKFMGGKTYCKGCKKKCSGEVLRVNDVYFHPGCFKCKRCQTGLSQGGFFTKDKDFFCSTCYQASFGTKCAKCDLFVEGEVVSALGKTYHQNCFTCGGCRKPFPTGERVTFTGKSCLCQKCIHLNATQPTSPTAQQAVASPTNQAAPSAHPVTNGSPNRSNGAALATTAANSSVSVQKSSAPISQHHNHNNNVTAKDDCCAGCGDELRDGQALMALDKQYHVWCFKCRACDVLLHGEYMGKDGHPYCERDYQQQFGVKCTYCRRFISGKVLQAGDNNHFHPTCARCTKCGEPFGDGEEMFLQGAAIWHPRCGPGPDESAGSGGGGLVINGYDNAGNASYAAPGTPHHSGGHHIGDDGASMASAPFYGSRASSPGASLRRGDPYYESGRFSRSTTQIPGGWNYAGSGLYSSSSTYSLRRPIEAGDRSGSSAHLQHFHLPASRRSSTSRFASGAAPPSRMSTDNLNGSSAAHRPISCPPKPGYTHSARSATLPSTPGGAGGYGTAISPGPGMHFNDFVSADGLSQHSFRTDYTDTRPYSHAGHFMSSSRSYHSAPRGHAPVAPFTGEYKVYPLHMLFTSNYKLPPDVDRCNLDKHLNDGDFQMAFHMRKEEFYNMPLWKRNDMKRRIKLF